MAEGIPTRIETQTNTDVFFLGVVFSTVYGSLFLSISI